MHSTSSIRYVLFGLMVGLILVFCAQSFAQVGIAISVNFAPPDLPVYEQPLCPGPDYIWTPGYWAWDDDYGYYWVPGTWVLAPEPDYYWTPAYWAWEGGGYRFFPGYWGPVVGFYGGIDYGYGYFGHGYEGGRWERGHFYYNRSVTNVNVTEIHNVYNTTIVNRTVNRVSYNGGNGGVAARPTAQEETATRERHIGAVSAQTQHVQEARSNPEMRASSNKGRPPIAATVKPGAFHQGTVAAREGGTIHGPVGGRQEGRAAEQQAHAPEQPERNARVPEPPTSARTEERQPARNESPRNEPARNENTRSENARPTYTHPNEIPRPEPHAAPNTGNAKQDQKYHQQQEKLANQQAKDRQKLQQRQDQEHQRVARQQANEAQQQQKQQMEQRHQQQTQQMMQRHEQQNQKMESRQQPHQQQAPPPVHANSHPPEQHKQ